MKRVLDVGNCGPDHAAIRRFFTAHFDCEVAQADRGDDALEALRRAPFDLVVVNRKLDADYTDGIDVIRRLKADPQTAGVPVMLVTNYADHQQAAVSEGALLGFGKLEMASPDVVRRVADALGEPARG